MKSREDVSISSDDKMCSRDAYVETDEQTPLRVGSSRCPLAEIHYSLAEGPNEEKYFYLVSVDSYEENKGHFRTLFDKLVDIAEEQKIPFLELYVHKENIRAQSIYKHLGFVNLGTIKDSTDYYCMRKDLVFG